MCVQFPDAQVQLCLSCLRHCRAKISTSTPCLWWPYRTSHRLGPWLELFVGSTCFKREKGKRKAVFSLKKKTPISEGKKTCCCFFSLKEKDTYF